jgi:uncharacterized membrane protein
MNIKQYKIYRLITLVLLTGLISVSISLGNYYLPIIFVLSAMATMYYCRKSLKTTEVMADERDYKVAGEAARYTISIYTTIGAICIFVLMAISNKEGTIYVISQCLAFSVCFLVLLNVFLFKFLSKRKK